MSFNSITKKQRTPFQKLRIRNRKHRKQWKTRNRCSMQKVFIKLSGNSSRNIYARISILIKLQGSLLFVSSWKQVSISLMASFQTSEAFTVQGPKYTHTCKRAQLCSKRKILSFYVLWHFPLYIDRSISISQFPFYLLIDLFLNKYLSVDRWVNLSIYLSLPPSVYQSVYLCEYHSVRLFNLRDFKKKGDITLVYYVRLVT